MDLTRLKLDNKSVQLGQPLVTGAAPKDTLPKPVLSVYIVLRNYPMLHHYATSYIAVRGKQTTCSYLAVVYLITLTG